MMTTTTTTIAIDIATTKKTLQNRHFCVTVFWPNAVLLEHSLGVSTVL